MASMGGDVSTTQTLPTPDVLESLEFEPTCTVGEHPDDKRMRCAAVAEWCGALRCCGELVLWCTPHREVLRRESPTGAWTCGHCHATVPGPRAEQCFSRIERIR